MVNENLVEEMTYKILVELKEGADLKQVFIQLGDIHFDRAIEYCAEHELVKGIYPQRVASGRLTVDRSGDLVITDAGDRFIESYQYKHR